MNAVMNLIWMIFGGFVAGIVLYIAGVVLCLTVIGIPFGRQLFKIAKLVFMPFGKKVNLHPGKHPVGNALWLMFFGWELALVCMLAGVVLCITIIGIPFGKPLFNLAKLMITPFGAEIY